MLSCYSVAAIVYDLAIRVGYVMNSSIKILVGYHKPDVLFKDDILTPIHLGRAIAKTKMDASDPKLMWLLENMVGDDTGDNISAENSYYNELTGVYWAWKNYDKLGNPDYIGFMHYRRHFIFKELDDLIDVELNKIDENYYDIINYSSDKVLSLLSDNTIIYHGGVVDSIYKHYMDNHDISQLEDALHIIDERSPSLSRTAHSYMNQSRGSFCNMFILPKALFFNYCEWIFDILMAYVSSHDMSGRRLFISERLTGIYFQYLIDKGYQHLDLPITLLNESITVNIAIPWENNLFEISTLIISHTRGRLDSTKLVFYIVGNVDENNQKLLRRLSLDFDMEVRFVPVPDKYSTNLSGKDVVFVISEILPDVNKIVFMTPNVLCVKDCGEFFRTSNVDDFWAICLPDCKHEGGLSLDLSVLNLKKLRDHDVATKCLNARNDCSSAAIVLKEVCGEHLSFLPYWMYVEAEVGERGELYDVNGSRGNCQFKAIYSNYIYYNTYDPRSSIQGIYSLSWWDVASKVPGYVGPLYLDIGTQWDSLIDQQKLLNRGIIPTLIGPHKHLDGPVKFIKKLCPVKILKIMRSKHTRQRGV